MSLCTEFKIYSVEVKFFFGFCFAFFRDSSKREGEREIESERENGIWILCSRTCHPVYVERDATHIYMYSLHTHRHIKKFLVENEATTCLCL